VFQCLMVSKFIKTVRKLIHNRQIGVLPMDTESDIINWDKVINLPTYARGRYFGRQIKPEAGNSLLVDCDSLCFDNVARPNKGWLVEISEIIRMGKPSGVDFILHGSHADSTATHFSDIDILALVNGDAITSGDDIDSVGTVCTKVLEKIYLNDPTAHHGLMVLEKSSLLNYDESFLPIDAISKGIPLGVSSLEIVYKKNLDLSIDGATGKLDNGVDYFARRLDVFATYFNIKNLVSSALILCVLWVQAKRHVFMYKSDSLDLFRREGPERCMRTVQLATSLRNEWPKLRMATATRKIYSIACRIGVHPQRGRKIYDLTAPSMVDGNTLNLFNAFLESIPDFVAGLQSG